MKEERLAVLEILANGKITAEEAERLLDVLQDKKRNKDKKKRDEFTENIKSAASKTGEGISSMVKTVGEKAEKVVADVKPSIKKVVSSVGKKASDTVDDIKETYEAKKAKRTKSTDFVQDVADEAEETVETAETVETTEKEETMDILEKEETNSFDDDIFDKDVKVITLDQMTETATAEPSDEYTVEPNINTDDAK